MSGEAISELPRLIGELFVTVEKVNRLFPGRPFTPDGHLVGSIGEVVAAYVYGLSLLKCSKQGFDALSADGCRRVEVKLTGGKVVSVSSDLQSPPDVLLVFQLDKNTGFREMYNGVFPLKFCSDRTESKRKVFQTPLSKLRQISPGQKVLSPLAGRSLNDLNRLFPNIAASSG